MTRRIWSLHLPEEVGGGGGVALLTRLRERAPHPPGPPALVRLLQPDTCAITCHFNVTECDFFRHYLGTN
eukprot:9266241-Pyramimonas_sp.AAC.1